MQITLRFVVVLIVLGLLITVPSMLFYLLIFVQNQPNINTPTTTIVQAQTLVGMAVVVVWQDTGNSTSVVTNTSTTSTG